MKASRHSALMKWFLIGFGIRASLAVVVTLMMLWSFEAGMLYLADLPTDLFLTLVDNFFPESLSNALSGGHPLYIPMNIIGCLLWGGIFVLIPLVHKGASWLMMTPSRGLMR